MKDHDTTGQTTIPQELSDPDILELFNEIARQVGQRGWALVFPANISEMGILNRLVTCGLITTDSGIRQFDVSGQAKSAEVICELTDTGKVVCSALAI